MNIRQAVNIQENFLPYVDEALSALKKQAVERDKISTSNVNEFEVFSLIYSAFSFFIKRNPNLISQRATLNGVLLSELSRSIDYYSTQGRVGTRQFTEEERRTFSQRIYEQVHKGMEGYSAILLDDLDALKFRQILLFSGTSQFFLSRYVIRPQEIQRIGNAWTVYGLMIDQLIESITMCLRTS